MVCGELSGMGCEWEAGGVYTMRLKCSLYNFKVACRKKVKSPDKGPWMRHNAMIDSPRALSN